jgi:hypothetical protein
VLPSINADQLPGHAFRIEEIAQRGTDIARVHTPAENGCGALAGEVILALAQALQRRAGPDGIDAQTRGQACAAVG